MGVWVSGGISGGHINPAVTIAFATFRDFPWRKVPAYIFAQVMGGLCGAGIVYANYIHAIDLVEGGRHVRTVPGTASLFSTYAVSTEAANFQFRTYSAIPVLQADYMTSVSCFFDEVNFLASSACRDLTMHSLATVPWNCCSSDCRLCYQ